MTFKQTADIDLNEISFTPIGNDGDKYFKGTYDGDGKTIRNLTVTANATCQGLFGRVDADGMIQNLNVSKAKISGAVSVAVVAGYNEGTVTNCIVSDSEVTGDACWEAANDFYVGSYFIGGVVGNNFETGTVSNCFAKNCTIKTTTTDKEVGALVGKNFGTATGYYYNCAVSNSKGTLGGGAGTEINTTTFYKLNLDSLPDGVTASSVIKIDGEYCAPSGATITLTPKTGYTVSPNLITVTEDTTITATLAFDTSKTYALQIDGVWTLATAENTTDFPDLTQIYEITLPAEVKVSGGITINGKHYVQSGEKVTINNKEFTVTGNSAYVSYIDANGKTQNTLATILTGNETTLDEGWYVVNSNITYNGTLTINNRVNLILADGGKFTIDGGIQNNQIGSFLTIYGQSDGTGTLNVASTDNAISITGGGCLTINGGNVNATSTSGNGFSISGGGDLIINGGQVTDNSTNGTRTDHGRNIIIGWTNSNDFFKTTKIAEGTTVKIKDGQSFYNGSKIYSGTLDSEQITALANTQLQPFDYFVLTLPDGMTATADDSDKITIGSTTYYKKGAKVTLQCTGYLFNYTGNGLTVTNNSFTMPESDVDLSSATSAEFYTDLWNILNGADGSSDKPYIISTAAGINLLTSDLTGGTDYSGKYFKLTSDIGTEEKNIGDATNKFGGTLMLEVGVKVKVNGGDSIEVVSGEINFDGSTFGSLDNGDQFKVGETEYTVGDGFILKSGKIWVNPPATVGIDELNTGNNWTNTIQDTITLTATSEAVYFYDADGGKIASFNGSTFSKENSSTTIKKIDASALTTPITIDDYFYTSATTITAGSGGVNVEVGDNKFSVVSDDFVFDGTKLISGTAKLSAENDKVKIGDNVITLTSGDGITVNATDSTVGGLNSGDKFTIGSDSYEVTANSIIKNENLIHDTATTLAIDGNGWKLHSGTVTVTDSLTTTDGKTLKVNNDSDGVTVTVADGTITSITGLADGGSVDYNGKSYKHTITLPDGATITGGDKLQIDGKDYYASGETVNIGGFTSGEITFDSSITSFEKDGENIVAKVGDDTSLTISGLTFPTAESKSWTADGTSANYTITYTQGACINDKKIVWQKPADENSVTVANVPSGVTVSDSNIEVSGNTVTVKSSDLVGATITAAGYNIDVSNNLKSKNDIKVGWNGTSYYTSSGSSADYYAIENGTFKKMAAITPTVTVSGLKSGVTLNSSNITVGNKKLTINSAALLSNGANITVNNGYAVELASSLAPKNYISQGWSGNSYYSSGGYGTAGWTLSNGKVYQVSSLSPTVTVSGLKSGVTLNNSNITVGNKKLTINNADLLSNGANITANNGYAVELASSLAPKNYINQGWSGNSYYSSGGYGTAGWTLSNGKVYQVSSLSPTVTVSGLKSGVTLNSSNITVGNKKLTINNSALLSNGANITADNGYAVELATSLAPKTTSAHFDGFTYKSASNTAGYTLKDSKVVYTAATSSSNLFTLTGVKNTSGIKVDGKVVTLNAANLNKKAVTISNGYTLRLSDDVATPVKTSASWSKLSSGKATYTYESISEGYSLKDNKVSYTAATSPKSFTVNGIKSTKGIKISGTTITLNAANLNKKTVSISDGYTLKLGSDVTTAVESSATLKNNKYTTAGIKTTGYKLVKNKISYLTKNLKTITFSGLATGAKASDITVDGKKITLGKNAIPTNGTAVSVKTSGYTLNTNGLSEVILSNKGKVSKANYYFATNGVTPTGYTKTTGSDKKVYYIKTDAKFNKAHAEYGIEVRVVEGKSTTYMAKAPSGYTKVIDANGIFYTDSITMSSALTDTKVSGKNLVLTAGKENITISGAAKKTVKVTANGVVYKAAAGVFTNTKTNAVTITANYDTSKGYKTAASIKSVDATKVKKSISINASKSTSVSLVGGKGNDTLTGGTGNDKLFGGNGRDILIGGRGNDSLWGNAGNDSLYGGSGNDTFIYKPGEGTDTIFNYQKGDMLQILKSDGSKGGAFSDSSFSGGDLTLKISGGGKVIFDNVSVGDSFNINGKSYTLIGKKLK